MNFFLADRSVKSKVISRDFVEIQFGASFREFVSVTAKTINQWFLTFLKTGKTFGYMKNLRNTKINDPKKQINTSRVEINIF